MKKYIYINKRTPTPYKRSKEDQEKYDIAKKKLMNWIDKRIADLTIKELMK